MIRDSCFLLRVPCAGSWGSVVGFQFSGFGSRASCFVFRVSCLVPRVSCFVFRVSWSRSRVTVFARRGRQHVHRSNALIIAPVHPHGAERQPWAWRPLPFSNEEILSFDRQDFQKSFIIETMTKTASNDMILFVSVCGDLTNAVRIRFRVYLNTQFLTSSNELKELSRLEYF